MQQSAFAGPTTAYEAHNFAFFNLQIHALEYFQASESFGNLFTT
jgi:hypothetical protein